MHPQRELTLLALRKAALRRDIAYHRAECVAAAGRVAQPLIWLGKVVAFCRKVSPLVLMAAVPLALAFKKKAAPRLNLWGLMLRWGPLVLGTVAEKKSHDDTEALRH